LVAHGDRAGPTGQELLAEFQQYGHQQPFEEIVRRYAGMVFNVCLRVTKDKHDAEDATQAVFLTLALQAKRGTEIKALGPWLQQVGKRLSLDIRRSKKRRKTREERHSEEQTQRIDSMLNDRMPDPDMDELKVILNEELQKLPAKYRLPLILHYYGGMSRDEMAAELSCKPSTLGVRIFRGREMLAGRLSGRGVAIGAGALAVAMSYTVKHAIAEGMITSTAHAAVAVAAGHTGAGLASASVLGLTRHAGGGALTAGKIKLLATTMILAGTSLGATAQAIGLLPQINVQKILSEQVRRMVQPLFAPVTRSIMPSLRADKTAASTPAQVAVSPAAVPAASVSSTVVVRRIDAKVGLAPVAVTTSGPPTGSAGGSSGSSSVAAVPRGLSPVQLTTGDARSGDSQAAASAGPGDALLAAADAYSGGGGGGGSGVLGTAAATRSALSTVTHSSDAGSAAFPVDVTATANSIYVPAPTRTMAETAAEVRAIVAAGAKSSGSGPVTYAALVTATVTSPSAQVYNVPVINGSLSECGGILSGYGVVPITGTLNTSGSVVGEGYGVDRTLNFTGITNIITNGNPTGYAGWYAADKGRVSLPLLPATTSTGTGGRAFVWGDEPSDLVPDMGNSVRLVIDPDGTTSPTKSAAAIAAPEYLSLLSPDRDDAPSFSGLDGAPIGLWEVDPSFGDIGSADLTVAFNRLLIDELGANDSTTRLWTLGPGGTWQQVTASSFVFNPADETVSGYATDFDYFAVTVDIPSGADTSLLVHPLAQPVGGSGADGSTAVTSTVPEPAAGLTAAGAILSLSRRRRRARCR
jgi:RNA polymerase sigma factor (sigma-70 family)